MKNAAVIIPFILTSLSIIIPPGPNTVYIATRSLNGGLKKGIISALGIDTGGFIYFLLATLGISKILLKYPVLFTTVKFLGVFYLFYIGISTVLKTRKHAKLEIQAPPEPHIKNVYLQGVLTCLLNPKVGVFFIAYLPQFVAKGTESVSIFTLGLIFVILGSTWDIIVATVTGLLRKPFLKSKKNARYLSYISGSVLMLLAITALIYNVYTLFHN